MNYTTLWKLSSLHSSILDCARISCEQFNVGEREEAIGKLKTVLAGPDFALAPIVSQSFQTLLRDFEAARADPEQQVTSRLSFLCCLHYHWLPMRFIRC